MKSSPPKPPRYLLCFSHLRWDFIFQRPQHLLSRFARELHVYFLEEPVFDADGDTYLAICKKSAQLSVVVPHLTGDLGSEEVNASMTWLLDQFFYRCNLNDWTFWYYTPMALTYAEKFKPRQIIYNCMDDLAAFKLVFTGVHSLYEAKNDQHANIFPFSGSMDKEHFAQARGLTQEPLGVPVISTPISDVIKPYGINKLVHIGEKGADFFKWIEFELNRSDKKQWIIKVDHFLSSISWDDTYVQMNKLIHNQLNDRNEISIAS